MDPTPLARAPAREGRTASAVPINGSAPPQLRHSLMDKRENACQSLNRARSSRPAPPGGVPPRSRSELLDEIATGLEPATSRVTVPRRALSSVLAGLRCSLVRGVPGPGTCRRPPPVAPAAFHERSRTASLSRARWVRHQRRPRVSHGQARDPSEGSGMSP
jgi:hypothetical protein